MAVARRHIARLPMLWGWRYDVLHSGLPPRSRLLLLAIAHHLRDDAMTSVALSLRTLATDTGMSHEAVKEGLRAAVEGGLLDVVEIEPGYVRVGRRMCEAEE